jgi:hypothetical protein
VHLSDGGEVEWRHRGSLEQCASLGREHRTDGFDAIGIEVETTALRVRSRRRRRSSSARTDAGEINA